MADEPATLIQAAYEVINKGEVGEWYQIMTYAKRWTGTTTACKLRANPSWRWPKGHWEVVGRTAERGNGSVLYYKYNGPADEVIFDNKPEPPRFVKYAIRGGDWKGKWRR